MGTIIQPPAAVLLTCPTGLLIVPELRQESEMPFVSLVIPTLNEADNIADFLTAVSSVLEPQVGTAYELIVVDDNSVDGTWQLAAHAAANNHCIRVVRREGEAGLASAVIRGWQIATGKVLGTINADFQHPPTMLARMILQIRNADLVIASRHAEGGGLGDWDLGRRVASFGAHLLGRVLVPGVFGLMSDPLSGCYLVRRAAIAGVELNPLVYKTLIEILVRGRVHSVRECGYEMRKRRRGCSKVGFRQHLDYIRHLVRLRRAFRGQPRSAKAQ